MAGSGRRTFAPGEVLTASNVMNYLQDQAVMVFAGTAARGSAIGSAVSEGMVSYLKDSNEVQVYDGSSWDSVSQIKSPNFVINGGFEINQRGFTSTTTSGNYGFDRWVFSGVGGTVTYSSQSFSMGSVPVSGFPSSSYARIVVSSQSASTSVALLRQRIEDARTLAGQTATISFWAKAASGSPKVAVELTQAYDSVTGDINLYAGQVILSTSWQRYSVTYTLPSSSGAVLGANSNLALSLWVSAGSDFNARTGSLGTQNNTFDFWGVQLEDGSAPTAFRRNANSIQGELAACQRYYYRTSGDTATRLSLGQAISTTAAQCVIYFPVTMRVAPTALEQSGTASHYTVTSATGGILTCNAVPTFTIASLDNAMYTISVASGLVAGDSTQIRLGNASGYLGFSSEL